MIRKAILFVLLIMLLLVSVLVSAESTITIGVKETVSFSDLFGEDVQSVTIEKPIVTIDQEQCLLYGSIVGDTVLTAHFQDGSEKLVSVAVLNAPKKVSFTLEREEYGVGEQFVPSVSFDEGYGCFAVDYASKNKEILCFQDGSFTALKEGKAKITAKIYNGKNTTLSIKVLPAPQSIRFDSEEYRLGLGETLPLKCKTNTGSCGKITYSSSDESIASVERDTGAITANALGTVVVTAEAYNGMQAECTVCVCPAPESIALSLPGNLLAKGETAKPIVTFHPQESFANTTLLVASESRANCVQINEDGSITGKSIGTVVLKAKTAGGLEAETTLSVCGAPSGLTLQADQTVLPIGSEEFILPVFPKNTGCICMFSSSRPEIATIDSFGKLAALSEGVTVITAETFNGKKASLTVAVPPKPDSIECPETLDLCVAESTSLPWAFPGNSLSAVHFSSSDPSVVTVDENENLNALKAGTAIVSVKALNCGLSADCIITVHELPESISLSQKEYTICVGETLVPQVRLFPEDSLTKYSYMAEAEGVLCINGDQVLGEYPGTTELMLSTSNDLTETLSVTVLPAPEELFLSAEALQLQIGETSPLGISYTEDTFTNIHCDTSDSSVATVEDALVKAISTGTAIVTVRTDNGLSKKCVVTVQGDSLPEITDEDAFSATFLNIGRNDGILLACNGEYAFLDAGVERFGIQAAEYMSSLGIQHLKYYIGTHGHKDHIGGGSAIVAAIPTDMILVPHEKVMQQLRKFCFNEAEKAAMQKAQFLVMKHGESLYLGKAKMTCLGPIQLMETDPKADHENYNSLILRIDFGETSYLLCADGMFSELTEIEETYPGQLNCDVLKTPHHFADQPDAFIEWTTPLVTVFSTDDINKPIVDYSKALLASGSAVLCTAPGRDGTIIVSSDGHHLTVTTENGTTMELQ